MTPPRAPAKAKTEDPRLDIYILAQQRLETTLAELKSMVTSNHELVMQAIGTEGLDERGLPIGTGLRGRVMRVEAWRGGIDTWFKSAAAVFASASLFLAALWWLTADKLEKVLK